MRRGVICLRATGQRPVKVSIHGHTAAALRLIAHRAQQNAWQAWHIRSFQLVLTDETSNFSQSLSCNPGQKEGETKETQG